MLKIIIPEDNAKLDRQIKAFEYAIEHDTREKYRCIHLAVHDLLIREKMRRDKSE